MSSTVLLKEASKKKKPHLCVVCNATFQHPCHLKVHARIHTGETPFKCPEEGCNEAYKQRGNLTIHIRRKHTKEKPFKCTYAGCDRAFTHSSALKSHIYVHTKERPYTCIKEGCTVSFTQSNNLRLHVRRIHGEELAFRFRRNNRPKGKLAIIKPAETDKKTPIAPSLFNSVVQKAKDEEPISPANDSRATTPSTPSPIDASSPKQEYSYDEKYSSWYKKNMASIGPKFNYSDDKSQIVSACVDENRASPLSRHPSETIRPPIVHQSQSPTQTTQQFPQTPPIASQLQHRQIHQPTFDLSPRYSIPHTKPPLPPPPPPSVIKRLQQPAQYERSQGSPRSSSKTLAHRSSSSHCTSFTPPVIDHETYHNVDAFTGGDIDHEFYHNIDTDIHTQKSNEAGTSAPSLRSVHRPSNAHVSYPLSTSNEHPHHTKQRVIPPLNTTSCHPSPYHQVTSSYRGIGVSQISHSPSQPSTPPAFDSKIYPVEEIYHNVDNSNNTTNIIEVHQNFHAKNSNLYLNKYKTEMPLEKKPDGKYSNGNDISNHVLRATNSAGDILSKPRKRYNYDDSLDKMEIDNVKYTYGRPNSLDSLEENFYNNSQISSPDSLHSSTEAPSKIVYSKKENIHLPYFKTSHQHCKTVSQFSAQDIYGIEKSITNEKMKSQEALANRRSIYSVDFLLNSR